MKLGKIFNRLGAFLMTLAVMFMTAVQFANEARERIGCDTSGVVDAEYAEPRTTTVVYSCATIVKLPLSS